MTTTIILTLSILFFILLRIIFSSPGMNLFVINFLVFFVLALLFHVFAWQMTPYIYEREIQVRNSLINTLEEARKNGNPIESANILTEIAKYNKSLALVKWRKSFFIFDDYIDDRYLELEPIK